MQKPFSSSTLVDEQQRLLRGIPAFAALPRAAREALAARLTEQTYPIHAQVLSEGEPADRLFLIEEGEVEVSIKTPEGRVPLSRLSDGEMFGEIALLLSSKRRTARVTAVTPLVTSTLRDRHLTEILQQYPEAREALVHAADEALVRSFIKSTQPFERLTPERLSSLTALLQHLDFEAGATVFKQGDAGDVCYLVRGGLVDVVRSEPAGLRTVARLGPGEIVGESALLTSTPRDASLVTVEPTELLALRRSDLIDVLDQDRRVAQHMVELVRRRDRPLAAPRIVLQPRPTPSGETIWVLGDPSRLGVYHQLSSLGLYVWNHLDGSHNVEEVTARYKAERGEVTPEDIARIMAELVKAGFASARQLNEDVEQVIGPPLSGWRKWLKKLTTARRAATLKL